MIPEQWLPLKVKVLLGYKMKTVIKWGWRINLLYYSGENPGKGMIIAQ